jgi:hypothetical protein
MIIKSLSVGINLYRNYSEDTLRGCLTDAANMRLFFHNELQAEHFWLTDAKAEEQRIKDVLLSFRDEASRGDIRAILYSHSSHGSNMPDKNRDEFDSLDEILCCHDLEEKGGEWSKGFVSDDWLFDYASGLPEGVRFECFFDSCHSQTMLREMGLSYGRAKMILPPAPDFTKAPSKLLMDPKGRLPDAVLWSGCDADKTSADSYIDGKWQGAFTAAFLHSIKNQAGNLRTRSDTVFYARNWLKANGYVQFPHLECLGGLKFKRIGQ